jgi:hypothetical protein
VTPFVWSRSSETVILAIQSRSGKEGLLSVFRLDVTDGRIPRFRSYGFCRDAVGELPVRLACRHAVGYTGVRRRRAWGGLVGKGLNWRIAL